MNTYSIIADPKKWIVEDLTKCVEGSWAIERRDNFIGVCYGCRNGDYKSASFLRIIIDIDKYKKLISGKYLVDKDATANTGRLVIVDESGKKVEPLLGNYVY